MASIFNHGPHTSHQGPNKFYQRLALRFTADFSRLTTQVFKVSKFITAEGVNYRQVLISSPLTKGRHIRLAIYEPAQRKERGPVLLWLHGGGYSLGVPEQDLRFVKQFIGARDCTIVAPAYTLSTSEGYPAALEDAYATLLWIQQQTDYLNARADQIMVGGNSAGGSLALALAIAARDLGQVKIAFQMPLYPMIDNQMVRAFTPMGQRTPTWMIKVSQLVWALYLGEAYGSQTISYYASPIRLDDYHNLPPTYTYLGTIEPFYDGIIAFMEGLIGAGVTADYDVYPWCFHGFDILWPSSPQSQKAADRLLNHFIYACDHYYVPQDDKEE